MFCPVCKSEYREGFTRCADCDVDLVPTLESQAGAEAEESIVVLWRGEDPVVFSAITNALQDAQIEFYEALGQDHDAFFPNPFPVRFLPSRSFEVRVLKKHLQAAQEIIREVLEETTPEEHS